MQLIGIRPRTRTWFSLFYRKNERNKFWQVKYSWALDTSYTTFQPALPNSPYLEISKNVKYIVSLLRDTLRHLLPDTSKGCPASYQIFELVNDIEKNQLSFWTMLVNIPIVQSDFVELRMIEKSMVNIKYMLVKNSTMDYSRSRFKLFFFSFSSGNHSHKTSSWLRTKRYYQ